MSLNLLETTKSKLSSVSCPFWQGIYMEEKSWVCTLSTLKWINIKQNTHTHTHTQVLTINKNSNELNYIKVKSSFL